MPTGLPKGLLKKSINQGGSRSTIMKRAWKWARGKKKRRNPTRKRTRRVKRKVARRRGRRRGGTNKSLARTMMKWVRMGALAGPAIANVLDSGQSTEDKFYNTLADYTGLWIKPATGVRWEPQRLLKGWGPYLMATIVTYGIPKIGGIIRRA